MWKGLQLCHKARRLGTTGVNRSLSSSEVNLMVRFQRNLHRYLLPASSVCAVMECSFCVPCSCDLFILHGFSLQGCCLCCVWESGWLLCSLFHFSLCFCDDQDELHHLLKINPRLWYDLFSYNSFLSLFVTLLAYFSLMDNWTNFSFAKASNQDPISLVPPFLVPVDPCDIHLELDDDRVSTESPSSLPSNQEQTLTLGNTGDPLHLDPSPGAVYWDSGGMELERGLDSGISIPLVSHSSEETCGANGNWKTKDWEPSYFECVAL